MIAGERLCLILVLPRSDFEIGIAFLGRGAAAMQDRQGDNLVALFLEFHAPHTGRGARDKFAHVFAGKSNGFAHMGCQQDIIARLKQGDPDQLVIAGLVEFHGEFAIAGDVGERVHRVAAHIALRRGEDHGERAPRILVFWQRQNGTDRLTFFECRKQVDNRPPAGLRSAFGQFPNLEAVNLAIGGEEQHRIMGRGDEHLAHRILILGGHASAAFAAPVLRPEGRERGPLDIAVMRDGDDHFVAFNQVFIIEAVPRRGNLSDTRGRISGADLGQFAAHDVVQLHAIRKDSEEFRNRFRQFLQLFPDLVTAESGQAVQTQIKDGFHLTLGQPVSAAGLLAIGFDRLDQLDILGDIADRPFLSEQQFTRFGRVRGRADHCDHFVEVGYRDHQTKQDMGPVARLIQFKLGPAGDDLFAKADEALDNIAQGQRFGPA